MTNNNDVEDTRNAIQNLKQDVSEVIKGREEVVETTLLALASQEHVMIKGKHGEAKSLVANLIGEGTEMQTFYEQVNRETRTKDIVGMLDLKKYKEDSELDLIETDFFNSHIMHFDEFLRGTEEFQDLLLEVMEERKFSKSHKDEVDLPVLSVIATTNPLSGEYNTGRIDQALKSRFAFVLEMNHLVEDADDMQHVSKAVSLKDSDLDIESRDIDQEDMREFREHAMENVDFDAGQVMMFAKELADNGFPFDTRFFRKYRQVCQVQALLNGEDEVGAQTYLNVAEKMFRNRKDSLELEHINDANAQATMAARHSQKVGEVDKVQNIENDAVFVEQALDVVEDFDQDLSMMPDTIQEQVTNLEKQIHDRAMHAINDLDPDTIQRMDSDQYAAIKDQYADQHTVKTKYLDSSKKEYQKAKNIADRVSNKANTYEEEQGKHKKIVVTPVVDEPQSFTEAETFEREIEKEGFQSSA